MAELPEALTAADADLRDDVRRWGWWATAIVAFGFGFHWAWASAWAPAGLALYAGMVSATHPAFQRESFLAGFADGWRSRPRTVR